MLVKGNPGCCKTRNFAFQSLSISFAKSRVGLWNAVFAWIHTETDTRSIGLHKFPSAGLREEIRGLPANGGNQTPRQFQGFGAELVEPVDRGFLSTLAPCAFDAPNNASDLGIFDRLYNRRSSTNRITPRRKVGESATVRSTRAPEPTHRLYIESRSRKITPFKIFRRKRERVCP